jgi:hypothetical protein
LICAADACTATLAASATHHRNHTCRRETTTQTLAATATAAAVVAVAVAVAMVVALAAARHACRVLAPKTRRHCRRRRRRRRRRRQRLAALRTERLPRKGMPIVTLITRLAPSAAAAARRRTRQAMSPRGSNLIRGRHGFRTSGLKYQRTHTRKFGA